MKKRLLSILLVVLFVAALLPLGGVTAAAVSGTVYASDLSGDVALTGNTTLILDEDSVVHSITGSYDLTVQGDSRMVVDGSISVKNLTVESGELHVYSETADAVYLEDDLTVTGGQLTAISDADDGISADNITIRGDGFIGADGFGSVGYGVNCAGTVDVGNAGYLLTRGTRDGLDAGADVLIAGQGIINAMGGIYGIYAYGNVVVTEYATLFAEVRDGTAVCARGTAYFGGYCRSILKAGTGDVVRAGTISIDETRTRIQYPVGGHAATQDGYQYIVTAKREQRTDLAFIMTEHYCAAQMYGLDDVSTSDWFHHPVDWALLEGITGGTSSTTFSPNQTCTRAQTVMFLWAAAGKPDPGSAVNPFTDVKSSDWYYKAVLWAVQEGITGGTTPTTFSPNATVTRGQVATFLYAMQGKPAVSGSNPFKDVKSGDWFYKPVLWAVAEGVTGGTSPTTFSPNQGCTRAQIVTFLYALLGK